ncbi:MAG: SIMPL domain-containing protein [bacterium]
MRRCCLVFLLVAGVVFLQGGPYAAVAWATEEVTITAQGKGSLRVTPDLALLYMGVEVTAPTAQEAAQENAGIMQAVLNKLSFYNIPRDQIKTTWFSLWRVTEYQAGEQKFKGFRVSHMVEVPVTEIPKVGEVLDAAVNAGVNVVNNVNFSVQDPKQAYQKALLQAVEDAHSKAEALAQAQGLKIKEIKRVVEKQAFAPQYGAEGGKGEFAITPFVPGQLKIEAVVEVTFSVSEGS